MIGDFGLMMLNSTEECTHSETYANIQGVLANQMRQNHPYRLNIVVVQPNFDGVSDRDLGIDEE